MQQNNYANTISLGKAANPVTLDSASTLRLNDARTNTEAHDQSQGASRTSTSVSRFGFGDFISHKFPAFLGSLSTIRSHPAKAVSSVAQGTQKSQHNQSPHFTQALSNIVQRSCVEEQVSRGVESNFNILERPTGDYEIDTCSASDASGMRSDVYSKAQRNIETLDPVAQARKKLREAAELSRARARNQLSHQASLSFHSSEGTSLYGQILESCHASTNAASQMYSNESFLLRNDSMGFQSGSQGFQGENDRPESARRQVKESNNWYETCLAESGLFQSRERIASDYRDKTVWEKHSPALFEQNEARRDLQLNRSHKGEGYRTHDRPPNFPCSQPHASSTQNSYDSHCSDDDVSDSVKENGFASNYGHISMNRAHSESAHDFLARRPPFSRGEVTRPPRPPSNSSGLRPLGEANSSSFFPEQNQDFCRSGTTSVLGSARSNLQKHLDLPSLTDSPLFRDRTLSTNQTIHRPSSAQQRLEQSQADVNYLDVNSWSGKGRVIESSAVPLGNQKHSETEILPALKHQNSLVQKNCPPQIHEPLDFETLLEESLKNEGVETSNGVQGSNETQSNSMTSNETIQSKTQPFVKKPFLKKGSRNPISVIPQQTLNFSRQRASMSLRTSPEASIRKTSKKSNVNVATIATSQKSQAPMRSDCSITPSTKFITDKVQSINTIRAPQTSCEPAIKSPEIHVKGRSRTIAEKLSRNRNEAITTTKHNHQSFFPDVVTQSTVDPKKRRSSLSIQPDKKTVPSKSKHRATILDRVVMTSRPNHNVLAIDDEKMKKSQPSQSLITLTTTATGGDEVMEEDETSSNNPSPITQSKKSISQIPAKQKIENTSVMTKIAKKTQKGLKRNTIGHLVTRNNSYISPIKLLNDIELQEKKQSNCLPSYSSQIGNVTSQKNDGQFKVPDPHTTKYGVLNGGYTELKKREIVNRVVGQSMTITAGPALLDKNDWVGGVYRSKEAETLAVQVQAKIAALDEELKRLRSVQEDLSIKQDELDDAKKQWQEERDRERLSIAAERETALLNIEKAKVSAKKERKKLENDLEVLEKISNEKDKLEEENHKLKVLIVQNQEEHSRREANCRRLIDKLNNQLHNSEKKCKSLTSSLSELEQTCQQLQRRLQHQDKVVIQRRRNNTSQSIQRSRSQPNIIGGNSTGPRKTTPMGFGSSQPRFPNSTGSNNSGTSMIRLAYSECLPYHSLHSSFASTPLSGKSRSNTIHQLKPKSKRNAQTLSDHPDSSSDDESSLFSSPKQSVASNPSFSPRQWSRPSPQKKKSTSSQNSKLSDHSSSIISPVPDEEQIEEFEARCRRRPSIKQPSSVPLTDEFSGFTDEAIRISAEEVNKKNTKFLIEKNPLPLTCYESILNFQLEKEWTPFDMGLKALTTPDALELHQPMTIKPDGRQELIYKDGHREVIFSDGMRKIVCPSGWIFNFFTNGDIRGIQPDRTTYYYFHNDTIYNITTPDGKVFNSFPGGQLDCRYSDGKIQVRFSQGYLKQIDVDGTEHIQRI